MLITPNISVSSSPNPATYGQTVVFQVTLQDPNGTGISPLGNVVLKINNVSQGTKPLTAGFVGLSEATFSISNINAGSNAVYATYSPNAGSTYQQATSATINEVVTQSSSTSISAITASPNPVVTGEQVIFTVTVTNTGAGGSPDGSIYFFSNGTPIGTVSSPTNSSGAVSTWVLSNYVFPTTGNFTITATYNGGKNFASGSTSTIASTVIGQENLFNLRLSNAHYGTDANQNLAIGCPITASSTLFDADGNTWATWANDGDSSKSWVNGTLAFHTGSQNQWLALDLTTPVRINQWGVNFVPSFRVSATNGVLLQYSDDNLTWTTADTRTFTTDTGLTFAPTGGTTTAHRYWQIFFTADTGGALDATKITGINLQSPDTHNNYSGLGSPASNNFAQPPGQSNGISIDNLGGVYVADFGNNRVLHFKSGQTSADKVYGQPDFTSSGAGGVNGLHGPWGVAFDPSTGGVYISDSLNNRVIFYPANSSTVATKVIGQAGFFGGGSPNAFGVTSNPGGSQSLNRPSGILCDSLGNLYVSDNGNHRVLYYTASALAAGTDSIEASRVYGKHNNMSYSGGYTFANNPDGGTTFNGPNQYSFDEPNGLALDSSNNLYVADSKNNRVLYFPIGTTTAMTVYGQGGSMTSTSSGTSNIKFNTPIDVALDSTNNLWVSDYVNQRVLHFPTSTTTADRVYGQQGSFSSFAFNNGGEWGLSSSALNNPTGIKVNASGILYIMDSFNARLLSFASAQAPGSLVEQVVAPATSAISKPTASANPSVFNSNVTFSTVVTFTGGDPNSSVTGTVSFSDGSNVLGTSSVDPNGNASFTTTTPLALGSHFITATFSGDSPPPVLHDPSPTSGTLKENIVNASTLTLATSNATTVYGQSVTLTATISPSTTGTISFYSDGALIGSNALSGGSAFINVTNLPVGFHNITASFPGNGSYASAVSTSVSQTVNKADSTCTTPTSSANPSVYLQSITFSTTTAAVTPGSGTPTGVVNWSLDGTVIGSSNLSAGVATFTLATGSTGTITATYGGDSNFNAAPQTSALTQTVNPTPTTTTTPTSTVNPSAFNQPVTIEANVSATSPGGGIPTGTISFIDDSLTVGNLLTANQASFESGTTGVSASNATLTQSNITALNGSYSLGINIASTATTQINTPTGLSGVPILPSTQYTALASLNIETGTVSTVSMTINWYDSSGTFISSNVGTNIGEVLGNWIQCIETATSPSNAAYLALTVSINAPTSGDNHYLDCMSVATGNSPNWSLPGATVLDTVAVDSLGDASFIISTLPIATHNITADYNGDGNNTQSNSATPLAQVVGNPAATSASTPTTNHSTSVWGELVTLTTLITSTGIPTGTASFYDNLTLLGTAPLDGTGTAHLIISTISVGTHTQINAAYNGDDAQHRYAASSPSGDLTQTVNKANTTCSTPTSNANPALVGQTVTFSTQVIPTSPGAGTPTGTVTWKDGSTTLGTSSLTSGIATFPISTLSIGTHATITATYTSGDSDFNASSASSPYSESIVTLLTPGWVAPVDGTSNTDPNVNASKAVRQFLGTHSIIEVRTGTDHSSLDTIYDYGTVDQVTTYPGFCGGLLVDQKFQPANSEIDRIQLPLFAISGEGSDVLAQLLADDGSGNPTGSALASINIPKELILASTSNTVPVSVNPSAAIPLYISPNEQGLLESFSQNFNNIPSGWTNGVNDTPPPDDSTNTAIEFFGMTTDGNSITKVGGYIGAATARVATSPFSQNGPTGWLTGPVLPIAVFYPSVVNLAGNVISLGGVIDGSNCTNNTYLSAQAADSTLGSWSAGPNLPVNLGMAAACVVGNYVYVIGGIENGSSDTNSKNAIYSALWDGQALNAFSQVGIYPRNIRNAGCTVIGNTIIVVGGVTGVADTQISDVWSCVVNPTNGVLGPWIQWPSLPDPRDMVSLATVNDGIVACGGHKDTGGYFSDMYSLSIVNNVPSRDGWATYANPAPSYGNQCAVASMSNPICVTVIGPNGAHTTLSTMGLVSVPLRITGLNTSLNYHLQLSSPTANPSNASSLRFNGTNPATWTLTNPSSSGTFSNGVRITNFAGETGDTRHLIEDQNASSMPRWSSFIYDGNGVPLAISEKTGNTESFRQLIYDANGLLTTIQ